MPKKARSRCERNKNKPYDKNEKRQSDAGKKQRKIEREYWRYREAVVGDRPELNCMDFHLLRDYMFAVDQNIIRTSSLAYDHADFFGDGNQTQLLKTMLNTWLPPGEQQPCGVPTGPRIVEDHSLLPTVVDKVIEYKGGVVPDYVIHNPGCSKRRRKAAEKAGSSSTPSKSSSRIYEPSERVAAVTEQRTKVLKEKAKKMANGS